MLVKVGSAMENPIILYRPMLKLSEKTFFRQFCFFRQCHFWLFPKRELKKNDFFHLSGYLKIEPSIQTYYMYTSNKKLEIYLDPPKDRIGLRFNL